MNIRLSPKAALYLFIALVIIVLAQAVWWIIFMARLVDEKVDIADQLGADALFVETLHSEEIGRQIMVGLEGVFFLVITLVGAWLIYRSLVATAEMKFRQQNFLLSVTHELKTPLASLTLYLDTLQSEKVPAEKKQHVFPRMRTDVLRLHRMVEDILETTRFERHQYRHTTEPVAFTELVAECLEEAGRQPAIVPVTIDRDLQAGVVVDGDRLGLKRAISAILDNALKYHDGKQVRLTVKLGATGGMVRLNIADSGVGLAKKDTEAVFGRFYRVGDEMTRSTSGTGIGLYLGREIVRAHGGTLTAHSEGCGKGAEFVMTLKQGTEG